jgi:hypothetical protein
MVYPSFLNPAMDYLHVFVLRKKGKFVKRVFLFLDMSHKILLFPENFRRNMECPDVL